MYPSPHLRHNFGKARQYTFTSVVFLAGLARTLRFFEDLRVLIAPFGVRRGFKMILSHRARSSLNMSSYRAIWTHFGPNSIFCSRCDRTKKIRDFFLNCRYPHLATLINIWHVWEDGSQKVNMNEPDLRICHGNFWPVIGQAVRKPCPLPPFPQNIQSWHLVLWA